MTRATKGIVFQHPNVRTHDPHTHDRVPRIAIAKRIADLHGYDFSERYDADAHAGRPMYFVPDDTLTCAQAQEVGIRGEEDVFGGVVPYPFLATKAVTHPLVDEDACAPVGWSRAVAPLMGDAVLAGFTVFSAADARRAIKRMFANGCARLKSTKGIGGHGQSTVADDVQFENALSAIGDAELERDGLVIEQHLDDVITYSVGEVYIAGLRIAYCGTQLSTANNAGQATYGGSCLTVIRGGFSDLLDADLAPEMLNAAALALRYDAAIASEFPQFLASRRNYDVLRGRDSDGNWTSGVLEQSWRIGGASGAEIAALEVFKADGARHLVRASCFEMYGIHQAPPDAQIYFDGVDEHVGRILKYTCVDQ